MPSELQFRELAAFAQFGSDLDAKTKAQLDRGARIVELFKQPQLNPISIEVQVSVLWALQKEYFSSVDVKQVVAASLSLRDYLIARKDSLLTKIRTKAALDAEIEAELKTACDEWKGTYAAK